MKKMQNSSEQTIDLEEAVGSYLNCLSTSCAAGSKLYTSVGKLVDDKFQELFPGQEPKLFFQALQTQNAFEGYQKALLECKEKLLEILIDNHTKKQPTKEKTKQNKKSSEEEQYAGVALRVAKELYCYHQTVADVLKPLHFSDCQEDVENPTLTNIDGKGHVVTAWMTITEANKLLRSGYGLTNTEVSQILSWQHGEDITESSRKKLNQQVNLLMQQYVDRMYCHAVCEVDIPVAFNSYPEDIQKVLQNCCSPTECLAASSQGFLTQKEEVTTMLHRELPRVCLCLNGKKIEKAHPGKAYENATLKMRAVRESILSMMESKKIEASKEQLDMFCLRLLAIASISTASASSRTAVAMAFGKVNLVQVQPIIDNEKFIFFDVHKDTVEIRIQSKWAIVEDTVLFSSLCRGNTHQIATIHVTYHAEINIEQFFVKRIDPVPVAHITQCILQQAPSNQGKKEQGRERSKSIKVKLTKATTKLFQRKSVSKFEMEADIITNEFAREMSDELEFSSKTASENGYNTSSDSQDEFQPVPPPRHKRKAKKSKKGTTKEKRSLEAKKEDLGWFSTSTKFGIPLVPTLSGSKDQSPSIASFEELQGVINFLSGSSTSSLAINEKGEKLRHNLKTHKRNNSTTSLPQGVGDSKTKTNSEGKLKLCHKKSASFSGKTSDLNNEKSSSADAVLDTLKKESELLKKQTKTKETSSTTTATESEHKGSKQATSEVIVGVERTPGDGMDNRINKDLFTSTVNIDSTTTAKTSTTTSDSVEKEPDTKDEKKHSISSSTIATDTLKHSISSSTIVTDTLKQSISCSTIVTDTLKQSISSSTIVTDTLPLQTTNKSEINESMGIAKTSVESLPSSVVTHLQPFFGSSDLSTDSKLVTLTKDFQDMEVAKSMPNNLHAVVVDQNLHKASSTIANQQQTSPKETQMESPINPSPKTNSTSSEPSIDLSSIDTSAFELEVPPEKQSQTLYEPFNSRAGWPVGLSGNNALGGSRFKSLWSEATLETEKQPITPDERMRLSPSVSTSSQSSAGGGGGGGGKSAENEFTLDKQQDFHKLLEGSKFLTGYHQSYNENWKDRSYYPGSQGNNDYPPSSRNFPPSSNNTFEVPPTTSDPWPVQSSFAPRNFPTPSAMQPQQQQQQQQQSSYNNYQHQQHSRNSIEALQLPPNPVGPYMRQNREQLLAKQQILEQYARSQKQLQIQQQQQKLPPKQSIAMPPSQQMKGSMNSIRSGMGSGGLDRMSSMGSGGLDRMSGMGSGGLDRMSNMGSGGMDRMSSLGSGGMDRVPSIPPPGLGNPMSKYDLLPDRPERPYFHRSISQQQHQHQRNSMAPSSQQFPFGNSMKTGISSGNLSQTRSVSDIRMENAAFLPDQFAQMNERNPYRDHFNQAQPDVFSTRY